jgi:arginine deiminase
MARPRSGSQTKRRCSVSIELCADVRQTARRNNSSHSRFRLFEQEPPADKAKDEHEKFAHALVVALQKELDARLDADEDHKNFDCLNSPIRESIFNSSKASEHQPRLRTQRSQLSLIVESVAKILDDNDNLEERIKRPAHNFVTGPPSEVHH